MLLALGEAQARQGDDARAKATFLYAADVARAAGESELLARATAGYGGRFLWSHGLTDDRLVPLLEEGISVVGTADSALRVRLLSRLAAALRHGPTRARREVLMEEAIQMARRIGDPVTIASALTAAESALHAPHTVHARLANAGEIVELATLAGDRERLFDGHEHAFWASWEVGDPDRRARELAAMTRVANELRQPAQLWMLSAAHATLALAQGRFDEAPALMRRAAEIGGPALAWNAGAARILQRFLLCCARGGLDAYLAEVRDDEPAFPSPLVHRSVLAYAYARLGRVEEAAPLVAEITSHDLADWHVDEQWFVSICLLAETCALLGRRRARGRPVRPAGRRTRSTPRWPFRRWRWTRRRRPLGILAVLLERYEAAEAHFQAAAAMNERMGARPWLAHTWSEHARLLARLGDARATELQGQAEAIYRELGMEPASRGLRLSPRRRR